MTNADQAWTRHVRSWRDAMREHYRRWLNSPERISLLVAKHPLPWTIDRDWTYEVITSDGACVTKKKTYEEAAAFIATAEGLATQKDGGK